MSKKKMCPILKEPPNRIALQRIYCTSFMERKCPSNTNPKCEIIPAKDKTKSVRASCDCKDYNGGQCYNCLNGAHNICSGKSKCNGQTKTVKGWAWINNGRLISVSNERYFKWETPCTITYKIKDTK